MGRRQHGPLLLGPDDKRLHPIHLAHATPPWSPERLFRGVVKAGLVQNTPPEWAFGPWEGEEGEMDTNAW